MLKKHKILAAIITASVMTSTLIGCGSKSTSASNTQGSNEPVTITYSIGKESTGGTQKIIEAFEKKYPNIKVNLQELPTSPDDQHNTYVTALSAGDSSIDVLQIDSIWPAEFIAADWLLPLDDKFTKEMRDKCLPGPIEGVTYEGHVYAVPRYIDGGVLYYRKDIIPNPPKTWDELIEMSKKYVGQGGTQYGMVFQGNQSECLVCDAVEFIGSNGGSIMSDGKVTVNSPQTIGGIQYMVDLVQQKIAPAGVTTYQEEDARNIFQQGKALFMRNWPYAWALANKDDSAIKDKVGIAPIPAGKDGKTGTPCLGGWDLAINKNSTHPEEAWKFIEFATSEEGQKIGALQGGTLPTLKSLYEDKDILAQNPYWSTLYQAFTTAVPRPVSPFYSKISDSMQINIHKAITGEITAEQAVKNMEKELNKINEKSKQ